MIRDRADSGPDFTCCLILDTDQQLVQEKLVSLLLSNASNDSGCHHTEFFFRLKDNLQFFIYYIVVPIYFFVGLSGTLILLIAFLKQVTKDDAYAYQVFFIASSAVEIFFSSLFWWAYKWHAGVEGPGSSWYMNNYVLMFYAAHIGCPLSNGFILTSLLFSLAMTADRVFALAKPIAYKMINHRKHQIVAACFCVLIGLSTSIFEVRRWHVLPAGGNASSTNYVIRFNHEYLSTELVMALGHLRTGIRVVCLLALVTLNVMLLVIFRRHNKKLDEMTCSNDKKENERKAANKTLLILTICQSCLTFFSHIPHCIYFSGAFMSPKLDMCYGSVASPIADCCICIGDAADVFVVIGTNKRTRHAVFRAYPCCRKMAPPTTTTMMASPGVIAINTAAGFRIDCGSGHI